MKMIQFGAENGSTLAGKTIRPYKKILNDIFFSDSTGSLYKGLAGMSVMFRLSGKNKIFLGEGPGRLKKEKGRSFITVDLVIPEENWSGMAADEFVEYLSEGIGECFFLLKSLAIENGFIIDEKNISDLFEKGLNDFRNRT